MDAAEMEKMITIPLEEKLSIMGSLYEIRSVAEYGKSMTTVYFDRKVSPRNSYLALRNIVDTLYNTLPQAVQKPRIYSSSADKKAMISIAAMAPGNLNNLRNNIETNLKKSLEAVEGVAEVLVTGGSIDEIRIEFDPERITELGINPGTLGNIVRDANAVSPNGFLYGNLFDKTIRFNTKIGNLEQIKQLPVKAGEQITSLGYFAGIDIYPRDSDEIVRINGQECIGIQIIADSTANIIKASADCKKIIDNSDFPSGTIQILYDHGDYLFVMIKNILTAIVQGFIAVIIIIPFFFKSVRVTLLLVLLLPVNILWTAAVLYLFGFSLDQNILSGISISLGLIVDGSLIVAGISEKNRTITGFWGDVNTILRSIIASTFTTILVLLPLFFLDSIVPGIRSVAVTIAIMLVNSLVLSCFFLPCFVFTVKHSPSVIPSGCFNFIKRFYTRLAFIMARFSVRNRKFVTAVYIFLIFTPFILFFISGKNISLDVQEKIIFASVEYEPEKTGSSIDKELAAISEKIKNEYGVTFLRTGIRNGTADLEIGYDDRLVQKEELALRIMEYSPYTGNGFFYVPDLGGKNNTGVHEIEIAAVGDETGLCREFARKGASVTGMTPGVIQTVLNFKNPEPVIHFLPDRDLIARSGLSVESIASTLRWFVFGPVVDKWIQGGRETDIRIGGSGLKNTNLDRISNVYISSPSGGIRLDSLGNLELAAGNGKIYRRDGRRAAYFTTHINASSTDKAASLLRQTLQAVTLDKGYGFFFPREIELLNRHYRTLLFAFIGSILGVILILTALTEDVIRSLVIASIIPVSCVAPLFIKFLLRSPLEMGDIVGMVIISGVSVNNAIYIAESNKSSVQFRLREKIQSILVTSLTSMVGAVPLVLMTKNSFSSTLAASILWGTLGSLVSALLLFPAVFRQNLGAARHVSRAYLGGD
jgi:HAE1 family hydrophobic/amphiphilic exporter-1